MKLTLLDLAKRSGSDRTIGLVEDVLVFAPELRSLPVVPKTGTSYPLTRRIGRPRGAFRHANEGSTPGKSTYQQINVPMYFFDGQMEVDEAIVKGDTGEIGNLLDQEGAGCIEEAMIVLGAQIYHGTEADPKGFTGFFENVDEETMVVDAQGTGATHTAWAIYEHNKAGVHCPIGNDGRLDLGPWKRQQVLDDEGRKYMAHVNNLSFFIGLAFGSNKCIGCVKNITADKPLTDDLGAELVQRFPGGRKPTRWLISSEATLLLRKTRSAIGQVATDSKGGQGFSPHPVELAGIPITETDSIGTVQAW